jgi:hypothetical protein
MLLVQSIIVVITICIALGLFIYFFQKNKELKANHLLLFLKFEEGVIGNSIQIKKRSQGLDTYHFLKYNLSEALIVQHNIAID